MHVEDLGPYRYHCLDGVFPLGGDSLALGGFATLRRGWRVCDLGTGSGLLLLLLARRADELALRGVELDPRAAENARENLADNGLDGEIWTGDLAVCPFPAGSFHLVVSNPPYDRPGHGAPSGPQRSEEHLTLDGLCRQAARLLRNGGRFALVHRPERLTDLMVCLRGHGLEPKRMRLIAHAPRHAPSAVLLECVKQGRPGLLVEPSEG